MSREAGPKPRSQTAKVAFINQPFDAVLPPHQNSIGLWTYHVVRRLPSNWRATVYAKKMSIQSNGNGADIRNTGFHFVTSVPNCLWNSAGKVLGPLYPRASPFFGSKYYYLDYISQVSRALRLERPDIVHIHNFSQFAPVVRATIPDARIVLHMNGEWLSQLNRNVIEKRIRSANLVFGSSDHITNKIRHRFPSFAEKCQTVFNGVDIGMFVPAPANRDPRENNERRTLLFVGRVSPEKGIHVLLDAFCKVARIYPNVQLEIVGPSGSLPREYLVDLSDENEVSELSACYEGDYLDSLQNQIPKELENRVTFRGPVSQPDLPEFYCGADIVVNPSFSESFGMSLVEAMACEKPVVATRVGGMQEIVDEGKTGLLVAPGDSKVLTDAILGLLNNEELCRSMGTAGRRRAVDRFSWDQIVETAFTHYEYLLTRPI